MCFLAILSLRLAKVLRLPRKSDARSYDVLHLSSKTSQNHLSNPEDLMLQNATFPRKSAAWPPNISDENVSCTAPATRNLSLQILFTCPTPANFSWKCYKTFTLAGWRTPCVYHTNDASTSKSGANMWCFVHFDFDMCFAPQRRALFAHLNFPKVSERGVLCTFWLRNMLCATTAWAFSTSQLPKVLRTWGDFIFFTSKSASRLTGVQFLISHLARWLRTRRFSKPTFRPCGTTNHWKNTVFRDFSTFSRTCIFFPLTLSLLWSSFFSDLLSSLLFSPLLSSSLLFSDSSLLCFSICPYRRKFDF